MSEPLLPCPFCGHSRPVVAHRSWHFDRVQFFGGQVGCRACGAEMFCGHGEQEHRLTEAAEGCAVAAWNLRAAQRSDEAVARALFKARGYDGEFFAGGPASDEALEDVRAVRAAEREAAKEAGQ